MPLNAKDGERDRGLDRAYGAAAREEPPARLDAAILAAARREVGARPRPLSSRLRTWRVPVSIAAVVVMSVSLVMLVREEGGDRLMDSGVPASRSVEPASPPPARDSAISRERRAPPEERAEPAAQDPASGPPALGSASGKSAGAAADRATDVPDRGGAHAPERALAKRRSEEPARKAEDSSGAAESAAGSPPQASRQPSSALPRFEPPKMRDQTTQRESAPAAEGADATAPRAAPAPAPSVQQGPAPRRQSRPLDRAAPELAGLLKEYEARPPLDWRRRIQELKRDGRADLAEGMLAEFKRRFPEHPLLPDPE
jgi:hypothetical protein